jgi:hypothetical protein
MSWRAGAGLGSVKKTHSADGTIIAFDRYGEDEPLSWVMGATAHRAISPDMANGTSRGTRTVIRTGEQGAR